MTSLRIVSVRTDAEVSRAELADDGTVTYTGGDVAASVIRSWVGTHPGHDETDAVEALARNGWSNGYLMVDTASSRGPGK